MLTLALESSAKAASAAVFEDEKMLAFSIQNAGPTAVPSCPWRRTC